MSDLIPIRRQWKCDHCQRRSSWRPGWNWKLKVAEVTSLDSFTAYCSGACREASGEGKAA